MNHSSHTHPKDVVVSFVVESWRVERESDRSKRGTDRLEDYEETTTYVPGTRSYSMYNL